MASDLQIAANRRNAEKSTGPKTEEGKEKSRRNALTHGLTAVHVPLRHEDPNQALAVRERLFEGWQPANEKERIQVEVVIAAYLKLQRIERVEANYFDGVLGANEKNLGIPVAATEHDDFACGIMLGQKDNALSFHTIDRYYRRAHKIYNDAVKLLEAMQKERRKAEQNQPKLASFSKPAQQPATAPKSAPNPAPVLTMAPVTPEPTSPEHQN